jgi:carboxypeptidase PM20D1
MLVLAILFELLEFTLAALVLVLLARALMAGRASRRAPAISDRELEKAAGLEEKLALLIRRATVSSYDPAREDDSAFSGLESDLELLFPRVHASMTKRKLGERALLYEWKGRDPSLAPALLCSHYDVVPAEDAAEWKRPPFSGEIAEGFVWGRGAQDIKVTLASALDTAERLLGEGFAPRRSLFFAFGGDEEVGGLRGAGTIAAWLAEKGIRVSFVLDEGGPVAEGMLSFADRPLALVGVSEKGYMDVELEARGEGGHASMPPRRSATGRLARALAAIEDRPSRARLCPSVRSFLERLAPYSSFGHRILFSNLWLFGPLVAASLSAQPSTDALVRTSLAPTMLEGSPSENVLAARARAVLNARILPGDSSAALLERLRRIARPFGVSAEPAHPEAVVEPLPESPTEHEGYRAVRSALAASFPEAACLPILFGASTDTKHYARLAEAMYRITPLLQTNADIAGVHGRDERVSVENLRRCAAFYRALLADL